MEMKISSHVVVLILEWETTSVSVVGGNVQWNTWGNSAHCDLKKGYQFGNVYT